MGGSQNSPTESHNACLLKTRGSKPLPEARYQVELSQIIKAQYKVSYRLIPQQHCSTLHNQTTANGIASTNFVLDTTPWHMLAQCVWEPRLQWTDLSMSMSRFAMFEKSCFTALVFCFFAKF
jgi:hypothetical protein